MAHKTTNNVEEYKDWGMESIHTLVIKNSPGSYGLEAALWCETMGPVL